MDEGTLRSLVHEKIDHVPGELLNDILDLLDQLDIPDDEILDIPPYEAFDILSLDTEGWRFDREEANSRKQSIDTLVS